VNGAETLVKTLLASNVNVCFANPGTSEMHFVAALDQHPEMRCILCLFEGGASGAADGYFRMSGEVAATLLHLAPGFGNAFANLHNARKAQSGIVNIVGDHATYHMKYETPLRGDTVGISQTISHWTRLSDAAASVAADGAAAVRAARAQNGQIATLILPANTAWAEAVGPQVAAAPAALHRPSAADVAAAAHVLNSPGAVLMIDGQALWGELSLVAARIAKLTGCLLMCPYLAARVRRGLGSLRGNRMAYRITDNLPMLADKKNIVLCGAARPASFFAYPEMPSVPEPADCRIIDLCSIDMDYAWTLRALADALGATDVVLTPDDLQPLDLPPLPGGAMSLEKIAQAVAALLPAEAIVVDEGISSSRFFAASTMGARSHDWLNIAGGAIGFGLPVAVGAAVACPNRKVVVIQGDGSAMYTVQSLWTMARENLDVTVVLLSNRGYQILRTELAAVGVSEVGRNAIRMFDVVEPSLDWVALAHGHGVDAARVIDTDQFVAAFRSAVEKKGPFLIEVIC
jgi:acetolactate synthase I/II/III large subunit